MTDSRSIPASASGRSQAANGGAIVVGGSGGLGRAICRRLAQAGWPVCLTYRSNRDGAEALAIELGGGAITVCADLRDRRSIHSTLDQAAERFGSIGALIYASGANIRQPWISEIRPEEWEDVIKTETLGFIDLASAALPLLRAHGSASIVSVTTFALYNYPPGDALSAVPKAAIEMMTRVIAKEEGRHGVRANAVAPGIIDAGLGEAFQKELYTPAAWDQARQNVALRRFGQAEEIADAVEFLASGRARYITGQTIVVDGGLSL
jgi:NAD(P)-dependent dehydrogenase (short-subunit alcohol dehydrogenase family)